MVICPCRPPPCCLLVPPPPQAHPFTRRAIFTRVSLRRPASTTSAFCMHGPRSPAARRQASCSSPPVVLFSPFCVPAPRAARRSLPQVPRHTPAPPPHPGSAPPMYGQSVLVVLQVSGRNCHALVAAHAADHVPSVNATVLTPPIMFLVSMHRFKFQCS